MKIVAIALLPALVCCESTAPQIVVRPLAEPVTQNPPASPCAGWLSAAPSEALVVYDPYGQRSLNDRSTGIAVYAEAEPVPVRQIMRALDQPTLRIDPRLSTHDTRATSAEVLGLISITTLLTGATWTTVDLARHEHHVGAAPLITVGVGVAAFLASIIVSPPLAEQRYATFRERLFQAPMDNTDAVVAGVDALNTRTHCNR